MASNPQTFQSFGRPLANSSNFFSQRDTEHQLYGLFSDLNLNGEHRKQQVSTLAPLVAVSSEDIELNDVRPTEKKLTTKQLRKQREAEQAAKTPKKPKNLASKAKKQNRIKIRFERRKSQKDRLDAINRDPKLVERRIQALKQLHACAQDLHNATENKVALKQALQNLTESLASHTEKTSAELYAELCQTNNQKSAEVLIGGAINDTKSPEESFKNFVDNLEKPVILSSEPVRASQTPNLRKKTARVKEVPIKIAQPTFKLLAPSRDQKIRNAHNWKRARPLIIDLTKAIERSDTSIAQSYAAARVPIKNLAEGLERDFSDVISEDYVDEFGLTDECHHYESLAEVPWDVQKYWHQRYSIFSLYDEGVYMTDDAWFGITPEPVAIQVASDMATSIDPSKTTIVDIFAGAGGNSIAFARSGRWEKVIAIEKDPSVIACAKNNAAIYGVADKITWINDDCFDFVSKDANIDFETSTIFASPPWGGPGYRGDEIFNLDTMQPYSAKQIHEMCKSTECALFLPRTSDLRQIAKLAPEGDKVEVVQYCMEGASKALVAYIPATLEQAN
ncbi:hypothetical protein V493_03031 [Pseudogymnoascus sp. VKM F-4281 (FW-2241)]|nr:hypothetical protein V493_03031 [Pseudogymnoascus sp. VKM F-4281 (FW-2241)]